MHVIFLQDYYPFLKGDKVEANTFCGRWRVSYIDENDYFQEYWVYELRAKKIIEIISNEEKINTENLKSGDKVWVELEISEVSVKENGTLVFWTEDKFFFDSEIKKIILKN